MKRKIKYKSKKILVMLLMAVFCMTLGTTVFADDDIKLTYESESQSIKADQKDKISIKVENNSNYDIKNVNINIKSDDLDNDF